MKELIFKRNNVYRGNKQTDATYRDTATLTEKETQSNVRSLNTASENHATYQSTRIFDNGQTVIDYYKQASRPNTVVITFDDMHVTLSDPPFGFKALMEQETDIIAVRKRKAKTFQQDLTKEEFNRAVEGLIHKYSDKVAYGFSLGAYLALYLTADLNVRILALSPKIPSHPVYGEKKFIGKEAFNHSENMSENLQASPVIVYDPENKTDAKYVHHQLKQSFPYGSFIKVPYGGHAMATHLLHMGILKKYITWFIHKNQVPEYKGENKHKSYIYYRNLAKRCKKHNKLNWADELLDQSLRMETDNKSAFELKVKVLREKGLYNQAEVTLEKTIELQPGKLTFRIMLLDDLMEQDRKDEAKYVLEQSLQRFGRRSRLVKREKKLVDQSL